MERVVTFKLKPEKLKEVRCPLTMRLGTGHLAKGIACDVI